MSKSFRSQPPALCRETILPWLVLLILALVWIPSAQLPLRSATQRKSLPAVHEQDFVGTWTASFQDKVFMTLWIRHTGGKWTGELSNGSVTFDAEGSLSDAQAQPGKKPVQVDKVEGVSLYLSHGGGHPLHAVLKLTGKNHAEFSFVDTAPGSPVKPKPFVMTRATPSH